MADGAAGCVSFLTDYGLEDGFVAACRGVLLRCAPGVPVVDITHLVPPGDIRRGAAVLAQTVPWLPVGIHLAVVDPGVGTARRAVVLEADRGCLVGPDNGLLPEAADALGGVRAALELWIDGSAAFPGGPVSSTFHGRDVFAPAAGELASGRPVRELGTYVDPATLVRLPAPYCRRTADGLEVEVLTVDRFGNAQLAAGGTDAAAAGLTPGDAVVLRAQGREVPVVFGTTFGSVPTGQPLLFVDSAGRLAVAVPDGRASDAFGLLPGRRVLVRSRGGGGG